MPTNKTKRWVGHMHISLRNKERKTTECLSFNLAWYHAGCELLGEEQAFRIFIRDCAWEVGTGPKWAARTKVAADARMAAKDFVIRWPELQRGLVKKEKPVKPEKPPVDKSKWAKPSDYFHHIIHMMKRSEGIATCISVDGMWFLSNVGKYGSPAKFRSFLRECAWDVGQGKNWSGRTRAEAERRMSLK